MNTSTRTAPPSSSASAATGQAVRLNGVVKEYGTGPSAVIALRGIDLTLERGTFSAIMGPSGSGKSTFLHTAAGLDTPTSGSVWIGDTDISRMRANKLAKFRRKHVGFVFQAYNSIESVAIVGSLSIIGLISLAIATRAAMRSAPIVEIGSRQ